jgi:serine/threonine protein kinase
MISILAFLRQNNTVHRDLKPGNILMNENWHLVLADFGTAKILTSGASND